MDTERWVVGCTLLVVVVASVGSGPLVSGVDLTDESSAPSLDPGNGSLEVSTVSVPTEEFRLTRGKFGSGSYYFKTPIVQVGFADLRGQPVLEYELRIEELDYAGIRSYFVGAGGNRPDSIEVEIPPQAMNSTVNANRTYTAQVILTAWETDGPRVVYRQNVSVEVSG